MLLYGGIEAGGTKFVCAIGSGQGDIRAEIRFSTTTPQETLKKSADFFQSYQRENKVSLTGIGIGAFGPLDLDPNSPDFGKITSTPKPGWAFTDIRGYFANALSLPVTIETDVNAAALAEGIWGAASQLDDYIYLTIGTGIGGGLILRGAPTHGLVHPEMGHILIPHNVEMDPFTGTCPFHHDCFEGLASGPALEARWGQAAKFLPVEHPAWALEAHYIALALHSIICTVSPRRIILGGGVMEQRHLFPLIRRDVQSSLSGYIHSSVILDNLDGFIVPPGLGARAGVLGAIALAGGHLNG